VLTVNNICYVINQYSSQSQGGKMRTYQKPSLLTVNDDFLLVHMQGTPPLDCSGTFPQSCPEFGGSTMGAECFASGLEALFLIPGVDCDDSILDQCTVTIDGVPASLFCDEDFEFEEAEDCAGAGCAVEFECGFNLNSCSDGDEVVISCPGFESCTQIADIVE
jgi:hypothetical protein